LTPRQAGKIASRAKRVVLAMDRDPAGARAAFRAYLLLFERGVEVRALGWEEGKDPDEALKGKGEDQVRGLLSSAPDFLELLKKELLSTSLSLSERKERVEFYARELSELRDPVVLDLIARELAEPLQVDYQAFKEKAESFRVKEKGSSAPVSSFPGGEEPSHPEEILARLLLQEHLDRFQLRESLKDCNIHPWLQALLEGGDLPDPVYRSWLGRIRHLDPPRLKPQGLDLLLEEIRSRSRERSLKEKVKAMELELREVLKKGERDRAIQILRALRGEEIYG
jgi:DNA primase